MPVETELYSICRALLRLVFHSFPIALVKLVGAGSVPWTISYASAEIKAAIAVGLNS